MKSYEEAKRIVASEAYTVKPKGKPFADCSPATQKAKRQRLEHTLAAFTERVLFARGIQRLECFARSNKALADLYERHDSTDPEGKALIRQTIDLLTEQMIESGYSIKKTNTDKERKALWAEIKDTVLKIEYQKEVDTAIKRHQLDPSTDYSDRKDLRAAIHAAELAADAAKAVEQLDLNPLADYSTRTKLNKAVRKATEAKARQELEALQSEERKRLGLDKDADASLASALSKAAQEAITGEPRGFLYFKCWVLPDDSRWYKVGITNDLKRRDSEQNVLPVAAETIASKGFPNIEEAGAVEKAFHRVLAERRIVGANNRELFHLKPAEVAALKAAIEAI